MKNKTSAYSSLVNVYSCLCVFYLSIFFFLVKEMENVFCIFFKRKVICFVLKTGQANGWYSVELTVLIVNWLRLFSDMKINNEDKVYLMYCCFFFSWCLLLSIFPLSEFYYTNFRLEEQILLFIKDKSWGNHCLHKCNSDVTKWEMFQKMWNMLDKVVNKWK